MTDRKLNKNIKLVLPVSGRRRAASAESDVTLKECPSFCQRGTVALSQKYILYRINARSPTTEGGVPIEFQTAKAFFDFSS